MHFAGDVAASQQRCEYWVASIQGMVDIAVMVWTVVGTVRFEQWFVGLDESDPARVEGRVDLLEQLGPARDRPDHKRQLDTKDKRHGHKELERH